MRAPKATSCKSRMSISAAVGSDTVKSLLYYAGLDIGLAGAIVLYRSYEIVVNKRKSV